MVFQIIGIRRDRPVPHIVKHICEIISQLVVDAIIEGSVIKALIYRSTDYRTGNQPG
ncbi:hypothetical protein D3C72_814730 [compost metagenome]